ncbi:hypothetical protein D3C81_1702940 [compost metagenome]
MLKRRKVHRLQAYGRCCLSIHCIYLWVWDLCSYGWEIVYGITGLLHIPSLEGCRNGIIVFCGL